MGFVFLLIVLIIIGANLELIINKLLHVDKKKISDTPGKRINRWGRFVIGIIYVCCLPFMVTTSGPIVLWILIVLLVTLFGFQAVLEWKYLKNTRQYISTVILLLVFVMLLYGVGILYS